MRRPVDITTTFLDSLVPKRREVHQWPRCWFDYDFGIVLLINSVYILSNVVITRSYIRRWCIEHRTVQARIQTRACTQKRHPIDLSQFELTDVFEMMHKAWSGKEEVRYRVSRSSIKFQGHTGWEIDDLNPFWVGLLGRSQLSNPSDLPYFLNASRNVYQNTIIAASWTMPWITCNRVITTICACIHGYVLWVSLVLITIYINVHHGSLTCLRTDMCLCAMCASTLGY